MDMKRPTKPSAHRSFIDVPITRRELPPSVAQSQHPLERSFLSESHKGSNGSQSPMGPNHAAIPVMTSSSDGSSGTITTTSLTAAVVAAPTVSGNKRQRTPALVVRGQRGSGLRTNRRRFRKPRLKPFQDRARKPFFGTLPTTVSYLIAHEHEHKMIKACERDVKLRKKRMKWQRHQAKAMLRKALKRVAQRPETKSVEEEKEEEEGPVCGRDYLDSTTIKPYTCTIKYI